MVVECKGGGKSWEICKHSSMYNLNRGQFMARRGRTTTVCWLFGYKYWLCTYSCPIHIALLVIVTTDCIVYIIMELLARVILIYPEKY